MYYGSFIHNLSTMLHPLNSLLQKNGKWNWTAQCEEAFVAAKRSLISSVLIATTLLFQFKLLQMLQHMVLVRAVPHYGRQDWTSCCIRLTHIDASWEKLFTSWKESFSTCVCYQKFHQYLYRRFFSLITDHKLLLAILGSQRGIPSLAAARLQHLEILLSAYTYEIKYKNSEDHWNADALSRLPLQEVETTTSSVVTCFNLRQIDALPVTCETVQHATRRDLILSKVMTYVQNGWPKQISDAFYHRKLEFTIERECLICGEFVWLFLQVFKNLSWLSYTWLIQVFAAWNRSLEVTFGCQNLIRTLKTWHLPVFLVRE